MDDTKTCPICSYTLSNRNFRDSYFAGINKTSDYVKRVCRRNGHLLIIITDTKTQQVDYLRLSLTPDYSKFLSVDFVNSISTIQILNPFQSSTYNCISIEDILEPDFPDLKNLQQKIHQMILFS